MDINNFDLKKFWKALGHIKSGRNIEDAVRTIFGNPEIDESRIQEMIGIYKAEAERGKATDVVVPGLGRMTTGGLGEYCSEPVRVRVLGNKLCRFTITGYDEDPDREAMHVAIANFLALEKSALVAVEADIFRYYKDSEEEWKFYDDFKPITSPSGVWKHVDLESEPRVVRREFGDKGIYVIVGCDCDWDEEHGLQIVFKNGLKVNRVSQCDEFVTNSDAFDDESLEDVVYLSVDDMPDL